MIHAGDEHDHWHDSGPCPQCGHRDCWNGCPPNRDADDIESDES